MYICVESIYIFYNITLETTKTLKTFGFKPSKLFLNICTNPFNNMSSVLDYNLHSNGEFNICE